MLNKKLSFQDSISNYDVSLSRFTLTLRSVCRRCFVKTIQMAVSQRLLPLRCVICRAKILRLKQTLIPRDVSADCAFDLKRESLLAFGYMTITLSRSFNIFRSL